MADRLQRPASHVQRPNFPQNFDPASAFSNVVANFTQVSIPRAYGLRTTNCRFTTATILVDRLHSSTSIRAQT